MPGPLRLILESGGDARDYVVLPEKGAVIGRKSDSDIVIQDTTASRHHSRLEVIDGVWHLRDMNSSNGTRLNDQPISVIAVSNGDAIRIGKTVFRIVLQDGPPAAPKPPSFSTIPIPDDVPDSAGPPTHSAGRRPPPRRKPRGSAPPADRPSRRDTASRSGRRPKDTRTQRDRSSRTERDRNSRSDDNGDRRSSRRSSRRTASDKPFYMQTPVLAVGGAVFLVIVIIIAFSMGGNGGSRPQADTNARPQSFDSADADELYTEASRRMSRKIYEGTLPIVKKAREKFGVMLDNPAHPKWVEDKFQKLVFWERQLGEIELARENRERLQHHR
ncbi:MAG: FHA domain-containing protein [Planctomycetes bacterium]|nr:FHA domain-containing protein [Planctomycetota bacterium]